MAKGTGSAAGLVGMAFVAYHAVAFVADAEQCMVNFRRWRANPTGRNLIKFLVAEGVLIEDIEGLL